MKKRIFFITLFCMSKMFSLHAQKQSNSGEILESLIKFKTLGSVLYIAAHPDDENTKLLTYLSKEKKVRTAYLSITRGDGGQNLIGKQQGEALGLIRTQELLAARKVDGAEQFFTNAIDFGYSKNPQETFRFWNHDSILSEVVWVIRKFKPDVIICRFPTTGEGGHGHHTASAILANEAFDAASDSTKFPEQLKYTAVWKCRRLFWNTFNFGSVNTTSPNQRKLDVGIFNPVIGKGYGEIAAESRTNHKSQGFGTLKTRGSEWEYFSQLKGDSIGLGLLDGINTSFERFDKSRRISKMVDDCIEEFSSEHPENSIKRLVQVYKFLNNLENQSENAYWKNIKLQELKSIIINCAGFWLEAKANNYYSVPGGSVEISTDFILRNDLSLMVNKINYAGFADSVLNLSLQKNTLISIKHKFTIPFSSSYSDPYWLKNSSTNGRYKVDNFLMKAYPENTNTLFVQIDISLFGETINLQLPLVYKYRDPIRGEVYRPFEILPPVTVNISERDFIFTDDSTKNIQFTIKSNRDSLMGSLDVELPSGWKIDLEKKDFFIKEKGTELLVYAKLYRQKNSVDGRLHAKIFVKDSICDKSIYRISFDHIPEQFYLKTASSRVWHLDLQKSNLHIGYIEGAGDEVVNCLRQVGYEVNLLNDESLRNEDLKKYQAIITGVRAYNISEGLQQNYDRLMDFVREGGNLIVQYNTNNRIGPLATANIGPYAFNISRDRVTEEDAEVRFLKADHFITSYPNKITKTDFENWIQERGIYFASDFEKNYEGIISSNDSNEKSNNGSLIYCQYGKGNFVYTGLSFFRELPAGVAGAYRLFANLIGMPMHEK